MKKLCIMNQKGGVAKTTTAQLMAILLSRKGFRVIAIDMDPQHSLSLISGHGSPEVSLYELFTGKAKIGSVIVQTPFGYDLIPGSCDLCGADQEFTRTGREYMLKELLTDIEDKYDYCVIDTPPALGLLTVSTLTACSSVIIPINPDALSLEGINQIQQSVAGVRKYTNPEIRISGVLMTRYNGRIVMAQQIKSGLPQALEALGTKLYRTTIRNSVKIPQQQFQLANLFETYAHEGVTKDYEAFVDEYLEDEENGN